jgi:hypothetical protein
MVQHGKEICKVPEDWAVADGGKTLEGGFRRGLGRSMVDGSAVDGGWIVL